MNAWLRSASAGLALAIALVVGPGPDGVAQTPDQAFASSGLPLQTKQGGYCSALAPASWVVTNATANGTGLDMGDGTFSAGYGALGVDPMAMQAFAHLRTPQHFVHYVVGLGFQAGGDPGIRQASQPRVIGDLYVQEFDSSRLHAVALYRAFPMPRGGYVIINRVAMGPRALWQTGGPVAVAVASSIRCQAQLTGSLETRGRGRRDSPESTYNAQLGTEYAHDPETGESFLMNHAGDWRETGPQGPGYYRSVPNGVRRLVPGIPD